MFNQQDLADSHKTGRWYRFLSILRYYVRLVVYSAPPFARVVEKKTPPAVENRAIWDHALANTPMSTYLGGIIAVDATASMAAVLIRYRASRHTAILDVGCGGGTLARLLPAFDLYLGIDVSPHAMDVAQQTATQSANVAFETSDIREFDPSAKRTEWDVVVFNEMLYLLQVDEAVDEVRRYAKSLHHEGCIVVSMKDDAKSKAIFARLLRHFEWVDGILWQEKDKARFSIAISREDPGYLIGMLRAIKEPSIRT
jgi:SAM-dependent methyltransferase